MCSGFFCAETDPPRLTLTLIYEEMFHFEIDLFDGILNVFFCHRSVRSEEGNVTNKTFQLARVLQNPIALDLHCRCESNESELF